MCVPGMTRSGRVPPACPAGSRGSWRSARQVRPGPALRNLSVLVPGAVCGRPFAHRQTVPSACCPRTDARGGARPGGASAPGSPHSRPAARGTAMSGSRRAVRTAATAIARSRDPPSRSAPHAPARQPAQKKSRSTVSSPIFACRSRIVASCSPPRFDPGCENTTSRPLHRLPSEKVGPPQCNLVNYRSIVCSRF